ncbi:hypothetical protein HPC49_09970 [Pyxidicoccus fallax]|uniref:Bacterial repeat domain-containing protein n=1 Tax=Pyxidicoccus fallax TaxID=394095 RepID=A0A848LIK4_9BACT|nr:hypothetical protein [Pyxidicoccus fallax]NMO17538.1 hypothetical protein [Pyxidicoccus fallax]NPC78568.1 hypothetical protein [Pyxidicoccus fallax]
MTLLLLVPVVASAQDVLLSDTFNRTSGLGSKWRVDFGSFTTDGTHAVSGTPPSQGNWASIVPALGTNDYAVSADIIVPTGSHQSGVVARSSTAGAFDRDLYAAQLDTAGSLRLYRRNASTWTPLASTPVTVVAGTSYNLKLVVTGASSVQLEVWLDGKRKLVHADTSASRLLAGIPGIEAHDAGVKFRNVQVVSAASHLFSDAFDRTTGLGASWQTVYGAFTTDGTSAISGTPPVNGNWARVVPALGTNDYVVSADIIVPAGARTSGLVARSSDASAFDKDLYAAQLDTTGFVRLYRRNGWEWTPLANTTESIVAGTSYNLKLVVTGSNPVRLAVWLNGVQRLSYDDTSSSRLTAGGAGLENYNAGVKYSNFAVDAVTTVSVPFAGQGSGTVAARGISCTGSCDMRVPKGTVLPLEARPASASSIFTGFTGDCLGESGCRVVANENKSITANLDVATVTLDIFWNGDKGWVDCTPECPRLPRFPGPYTHAIIAPVGTAITLVAHGREGDGWTFASWSGSGLCNGSNPTCTFTATGDGEVRAEFGGLQMPPTTIEVKVDGQGTVTGPNGFSCTSTCDITVPWGDALTLVASPAPGWKNAGWSGSIDPAASSISVAKVDTYRGYAVTAFFDQLPPYPCGNTPCTRGQFPPATWRPYGPTSPFNMAVFENPPLMANSPKIIERLLGDLSKNNQISNLWIPADGLSGWPTYYGTSTDPTYNIRCGWNTATSQCSVGNMPGRAPAGARIQGNDGSANADRHLTFIDQVSGIEYDLFEVVTNPLPAGGGDIQVSWAGYTMAMTGDGRALGNGEGNAAKVGNLAGRIRIEELKAAVENNSYIDHALSVSVNCTSARSVYPARPENSGRACSALKIPLSNDDAPPMGARLWLDMSYTEIDQLPIPTWKKVILRTLKMYGAIINDTGSDFYFTLQTESGNQYTSMEANDAWLDFASNLFAQNTPDWSKDPAGNYTGKFQELNNNINWTTTVWSRLKVLDPCVSTGNCTR